MDGDSNNEIDHYIEKLKSEIKELQESKKGLDFKLQLLRKRYNDELNANNDIKIDNIFKNSGAKEYLDKLKSSDKIKSDMISSLKHELETTKKELAMVKTKCYKAEEQCEYHKQQWRDVQAKKWNLEAEKTASQNRERQIIEQSINRSYASSYIESNHQPPPPVSIPTIEEILRSNDDNFDYSSSAILGISNSSTSDSHHHQQQQPQKPNSLFYSDNVR